MTLPQPLGVHAFSADDQRRFAALSADVNPMHMDAIAARRLITGRPVVHGIHTLLAALERLPAEDGAVLRRIDCEFVNPVCVDDPVEFCRAEHDGEGVALRASVSGLECTRITLDGPAGALPRPREAAPDIVAVPAQPIERAPESWVGQIQVLPLPAADFAAAFPRTSAQLGERRVAAIGLLSAYVGMVCPGLHSVFSSVLLEPGDGAADALRFEVLKYDPRFRLFVVAFDGCIRGQLKAFQRPPAQPQPTMAELAPALGAGDFAGRHAWVIGGSRGLGELAAKLVASGGGSVTLTHASGADDARRVADEINATGRGAAAARRLDLLNADLAAWIAAAAPPDVVFYFATPRIYRKKAGVFDAALFDEFMAFYAHRFEALCTLLERHAGERRVRVFVPSTVFIDDRPKGMTEYTMAKAAAEVLAADLGKSLRRVQIVCERLPRLPTDQTTSLVPVRSASAVEVLLPLVRRLFAD
ncbi:MaoC/PaaZ C-terminal domain-containing protein [Aquabacterium humicola]|uniref:MaoC/PaaZ C-terminal domain-containing protein n=1 Tax=Aquabacterium humicola TaxID=3237377 RepID=UPI0025430339|nr:MaoC/PaaZ C-terminal domain-containing protein [Rubrivivax pictus]